jgi:transcriptional regulator with PAS, ATPase and Fis domain
MNDYKGEKAKGRSFISNFIGTSPKILQVVKLIEKVADSPITVLITGESGTGKELAARTIHTNSSRSEKPFIAINCAALPESLLESELFGIEKGVATGVEKRAGKIEAADGGTLFLDEIGDMSFSAQAKLLRVLQERRMERVGGRGTIEVDVRVIAATNKDLKSEIEKESFRKDLYYRLNAVNIAMPSLREMKEDIPIIAEHFLKDVLQYTPTSELGSGSMSFSDEAMDCLEKYSWPGNVRELENEVKRAATLADSNVIEESDLSEHVRGTLEGRGVLQYAPTMEVTTPTLKGSVEETEIRIIKEALEKSRGNKQKAAKILGITRQGLIKKIKRLEGLQQARLHHESDTPTIGQSPTPKPVEIDRETDKQKGKGAEGGYMRVKSAEHKMPEAERRQLTVMFCDVVGFAALSEQFDPEDLREIIHAYQDACSRIASRFEGQMVRYPGDVILVYFGYPLAHEDNAQRAVRAGLEIVGAIHELPLPNTRLQIPLQVRVGIHTGLTVVGERGEEKMSEPITIVGETPNIASRLMNVAKPNTVVISSDTYRLVEGLFECRDLGLHTFKGVSTPLEVYRVLHESGVRSRFEAAITKGLTPLVGRDQEMGLLLERWERVKEGEGQVVLVCGEPGIGKSRLVQEMKERVTGEHM